MKHLIQSVERSLAFGNFYGALATALTLPDVCGWIANPSLGSKARYIEWFDRYVGPEYVRETGPFREKTVFLTGSDCYALRCAFLHEGREDISEQRAKELLERFQFIAVPPNIQVHRNLSGKSLQLQVDLFCNDICAAAGVFLSESSGDSGVQQRLQGMLRIRDINGNVID